ELTSTFSRGLKIGFDPADGSFAVDDPTSLLEHPMYGFLIESGPGKAGRAELRKDSTPDEATKTMILSSIIAPILTDIVHQQVLGAGSQARYLTDRDVDFLALKRATLPELQELSQAVTEGLSHAIPTLEDVSLKDLLRLRREEGEAFVVYRD